jgi:hypothetical protein
LGGSADELFSACHGEKRSDEAIQPFDSAQGREPVERLDCRGRLRLPRNDKPGRSSAAQRRIHVKIRTAETLLTSCWILRCAQNDKPV